jgi:Fe-S cluster assembly protein SufD
MKEYQIFKQPDSIPPAGSKVAIRGNREPSPAVHYRIPEAGGIHEIEIEVAESERLEVVLEQSLPEHLEVLVRVKARVGASASLRLTAIQQGGLKSAFEIESIATGGGARIEVRGLQNSKGSQQFSMRADALHGVPDTSSDLQVWCAARDESRTVFNGFVHILKGACRTEAFQKNRNLILSPRATVDSFPKLLIENDEVKCAHGSSTSSLEPEQTVYLQSRGLDREAAESMMLRGFVRQPLEWISDPSLRRTIEQRLGVFEEEWE